ncbi:MAG: ATP-binding protein [bacterium]
MAGKDALVGLMSFFFRKRKNYQETIRKYSEELARPMPDLDRFSKVAPYLLWRTLGLSGACMLVLDQKKQAYSVRAGSGDTEELIGHKVAENSPLMQTLLSSKKEVVAEGKIPDEIKAELAKLKTVVAIPVISESEYFSKPTLLAIIALGKKLSGEHYDKDDLMFLETIANQSAISIEYSFILEELKKNQEQVQRSEKLAAIGTTTAGIAHELKNPLTYLLTIASTMTANWDNPSFKESVKKMFPSEVARMKLIIDGLSDFSKSHELRLAPVDLGIIFDRAIALLSFEARKNNVSFVKEFSSPKAIADKDRLIQVFINIIANAIQAMWDKGGKINISAISEGDIAKISIADNGPGMPEETVKKVFDPFFTTKETGTGLGLSITKKIIDEHNGKLEVKSKVGVGTTFTICLPRA